MRIETFSLSFSTTEETDILDITDSVADEIDRSGISEGLAVLFVPGSTASLTTIEYEQGVIMDLKDAIERIIPRTIRYRHDERWGDGNGYSHVRAALLGPSLVIPIMQGRITLGTWQQIILIDFDNRPRHRRIIGQISGN
ncbi:MAG TPA: YjbQ family protein [Deltaproteobacteria bacterium]|nr:YjbQ family protein [Deltaproteobacteria bacterium]